MYVSLLEAARLEEALKARERDVLAAYERAAAAAPARAEALHGLARYCRDRKLYQEGYAYARAGFRIPLPAVGLFVEPWIYAWGMLDELSLHAYWTGRYEESLGACRALLANPEVPAEHRARIRTNFEYSQANSGEVRVSIAQRYAVPSSASAAGADGELSPRSVASATNRPCRSNSANRPSRATS